MVRAMFFTQFINTSIILLVVNANLTEHEPKFLTEYAQGAFYDYMPNWYISVGLKNQVTMLIQCVMPFINLVISGSYLITRVLFDSRYTLDPFITR